MRFQLNWNGGKTEIIEGVDIADAFTKAGYSAGVLLALDSYRELNTVQDDEVVNKNSNPSSFTELFGDG